MLDFFRNLFKSNSPRPNPQSTLSIFVDYLGNFRLNYPSSWTFDNRLAVVDGAYTISFESKNHKEKFVISVETIIPKNLNFEDYAKEKLIGPNSGVHATIKKSKFRHFDSFDIEYVIHSGQLMVCKTLIFITGNRIFFLSYSATKKNWNQSELLFDGILESLEVSIFPPSKTDP